MRCFVCRELSHSAKDCPQRVGDGAQGKDTVGICFRCGSTEHTLSQCKRSRHAGDELPFATCYICTNKVCRVTRISTDLPGPLGFEMPPKPGPWCISQRWPLQSLSICGPFGERLPDGSPTHHACIRRGSGRCRYTGRYARRWRG